MIKINNKDQILKVIYYLLVILIIGSGFFFRIWQLDVTPPGIHHDEAYNGLDGIKAQESGDYKVFYEENNGREGLYINLLAFSFKFFGINEFALRLISALFGGLTLVGFYLLVTQFKFSRLTVLLSLFCLSFSFWHLNFSRIVYRGIMLPFLLVWIFYFFYKGLQDKSDKLRLLWFGVAGLLTGVGLHTYISFRVAPLIFFILVVFYLFFDGKKFVKKYWKSILVFFVGALVSAAPMFLNFYHNPEQFMGRSNQVSIFSQEETSVPMAFLRSLGRHLGGFFAAGDPNQRHNHLSYPQLPAAWSLIFAFGFFISLKEIIVSVVNKFKRKPRTKYFDLSLLAQSIFWVMLIPGVSSIEGIPHALRIIGTIPAVFIFMLFPLDYIMTLLRRIKNSKNVSMKSKRMIILNSSLVGLVLILIFSGFLQVILYFSVWTNHPKTASSFEEKLAVLGRVIKTTPQKEYNFIITNEDTGISEDHKDSSLKTTQFVAYNEIKNFVFWKPLEALKTTTCEGALYVFLESDKWLIGQYEKKCPKLEASKVSVDGYEFWLIR